MKYFKNVDSLEDLRKQYKELLKKFHPDNPDGSTEATQEINTEYDKFFKTLKDKHDTQKTGKEHNRDNTSYEDMKYSFDEDAKLREILNKVIHYTDITIEIIGQWIWLSGNTYSHRQDLKDIGFKFACKQKTWYWHSETFRKKSNKTLSMNEKRNFYGSTEVRPVQHVLLEA